MLSLKTQAVWVHLEEELGVTDWEKEEPPFISYPSFTSQVDKTFWRRNAQKERVRRLHDLNAQQTEYVTLLWHLDFPLGLECSDLTVNKRWTDLVHSGNLLDAGAPHCVKHSLPSHQWLCICISDILSTQDVSFLEVAETLVEFSRKSWLEGWKHVG